MRETERLLQDLQGSIVSTMAEGICFVRASDAAILYANAKLEKMFGYPGGALRDEPLARLYDAGDRDLGESAGALVERLNRYGEASMDARTVKRDGTPFWCAVHASTFDHAEHGAIWVFLHNNITDRKKVDEIRRQDEARLRRLADANIIGIITADLDGRVTEANDRFLRMVGHTREELLRDCLRLDEMTPPEHRERDAGAVDELRRTGACPAFEKEYFKKDGSRVRVLVGAALFDDSRRECICFVIDLDEQRASSAGALRNGDSSSASAIAGR